MLLHKMDSVSAALTFLVELGEKLLSGLERWIHVVPDGLVDHDSLVSRLLQTAAQVQVLPPIPFEAAVEEANLLEYGSRNRCVGGMKPCVGEIPLGGRRIVKCPLEVRHGHNGTHHIHRTALAVGGKTVLQHPSNHDEVADKNNAERSMTPADR